jgi:alpha-N-arabinofuranosidase
MTTKNAHLFLHPEYTLGAIDPRLYGSFIEHLGRAVYGGIYEPDHAEADEHGFRRDVLALVRELNVSVVRYPGGNFVSGYHWEDGVGSKNERPRRLDPAWRTIETNQFGTNEFMDWCAAAGTEALMAVNLGTRSMEEARDLLEYCNIPGGTKLSDLRRSHGYQSPHAIKTWCLGNEMDGVWQMGHKTADEYGRLACETGRLMRMIDPSIELVACGSSSVYSATFPSWDAKVLEHAYDVADYISLHLYLDVGWDNKGKRLRNWEENIAQPLHMDRQIETVIAACDYAQAAARSKKRVHLCFDEWNVWWHSTAPDWPKTEPWAIAPAQLEDNYTMEDALVFGGMLLSLIRHADRVRIACVAQLVNVIAPILTRNNGPAWRQTIFWPLLHASRHARGQSLRVALQSSTMETMAFGNVPLVDCAATRNEEDQAVNLFVINRSEKESVSIEADLRAFSSTLEIIEHVALASEDHQATNSFEFPDRVAPRLLKRPLLEKGCLKAILPPASWNMIRIKELP